MRYTVRPGDTLYRIATRYGVSLEELIAANPQLTSPSELRVGQVINVPVGGTAPSPGRTYTVQPGDTLYGIANKLGVSLDALIAANPQLSDPSRLQVGQVINVPGAGGPGPQPQPGRTYTVQSGDSLYSIAQKFGVSLEELIAANPQLSDPERLRVGQVVNIPGAGPAPTPTPTPTPSPGRTYVVQPGDTLYKISQQFDVLLSDLIQLNPQLRDPAQLTPGAVIKIPVSSVPQPEGIVRTNVRYTYAVMQEDLRRLVERYPFLQTSSIGQSVLGKDLTMVRLGRGPKEVHYNGSHHAREWITTPLLMKFIEEYAKAYQNRTSLAGYNVRELWESTTIWVVPMVNPDGVDLVINGASPTNPYYDRLIRWNGGSTDFSRWKANIRGVDLNRQYRANWELAKRSGPSEPAPEGYAGPEPESEPEARAIANLTRTRNFRLVLSYHTQGEIIYWNYLNLAPAESRTIVRQYQRLSGYQPVDEPGEYASSAGYKDWFILAYKKPGFTIEVGTGVSPVPLSQFPGIYRDNIGILMYSAVV